MPYAADGANLLTKRVCVSLWNVACPIFTEAHFCELRFYASDSLRCLLLEASGYSVTAQEYISPVETPKNLLIKAFKDGNNRKKATKEYLELKKMLGITPKLETLIKLEAE